MMRRSISLFAGLLLLALGGTAPAQSSRPVLRAQAAVPGPIVTLGELVENAGPAAGIPVFRAPDLGRTGFVQAARVIEAAAGRGLLGIEAGGVTEIAVVRLSRPVTAGEIEDRLRTSLQERLRPADPEALSLTWDAPLDTVHLEPASKAPLTVERLEVVPGIGRFSALLRVADAPGFSLRVGGTAVEMVAALAAVRPIERGARLAGGDVELRRVPRGSAPGQALTDAAALSGLAARRNLRAGEILRQSDVERPEAVARNETVTVTYETPGLVLTTRGRALQGGAQGDVIPVVNLQSRRTLQATVAGPGRVVVAPSAPRPFATAAR